MGLLRDIYVLTWRMKLGEHGYSCFELLDERMRRWGWIVNAGAFGWTAHTGDWGQGEAVGQARTPVNEVARQFESLNLAKNWVEELVAADWAQANGNSWEPSSW